MRRRTFVSALTAVTAAAATPAVHAADKRTGAAAENHPVLSLPSPSGRHHVGTHVLHLIDRSRIDPWVPAHPARELMIQLWYPTTVAPWHWHTQAGYIPPLAAEHLAAASARRLGIPVPAAAFSTLRTAAALDAPLAEPPRRGWPTVLYSPGDGLDRSSCTTLVQDLASHGFMVVTIDHTHDSGEVQFPDGRVETRSVPPGADDAVTLVRTADARFVLDQLPRLNAGRSPDADGRTLPMGFAYALDLGRLGMFGHSHGGTTTAETLRLDSRVRAGADLDGSVSDRVATAGLTQAFLNLNSQIGGPARAKFEQNLPQLWPRLSGWHLWLRLRDSGHLNFTDFGLFAAQLQAPSSGTAGTLGPIDPHRALAVVSAYLVAFFNETLERRPQRLLQRPSTAYPEMIFETEPVRR